MTPAPSCDRLDAYLGGRLSPEAEAHFEAHVATCDACLDTAVADVTDALVPLGAVACPPAVIDAALAEARRTAPDRSPARGRAFRASRLGVGLAATLALVLTALIWSLAAPEEPRVAEVRPEATSLAPEPPSPLPPAPPPEATDPEPMPEFTAPPPPPAAPAPRRAPPPRPVEDAPPPEAAPLPEVAAADSVQIAREEVLLALAIVADAQDHATSAVTDGVGRVHDALHATPSLLSPQTP